jgi:hypothetical protein
MNCVLIPLDETYAVADALVALIGHRKMLLTQRASRDKHP